MRIVYFTHSLRSCWNHGNAHFLRGVLTELVSRGHDVQVFEPEGAWSLENLVKDHGEEGLAAFRKAYPELSSQTYARPEEGASHAWGADLVIVHEWNDPELVAAVGRMRRRGGRFTLLFHDTHHRAVSAPHEMRAYDLGAYDGVLAFGETLADVYRRWGWDGRVFVWHEAADTRRFHPPVREGSREGLVWIGNWGDGERSAELAEFLLKPARDADLSLDVYGVRYPDAAKRTLADHGARFHGWLANAEAPDVFAHHLATVHVPRRFYANALPGIPTIRVFEALACGIPLVSAPWDDCEHLFRIDEDFLMVRDGAEVTRALRDLKGDAELRASLVRNGIETILQRHTCAHRVDELMAIAEGLRMSSLESAA
ncbi:MAG: glycosyltransferase [Acidobacteria bacterium]|nr:glycosyltransferase [Acidobacteriota bacterium]